MGKRRVEICEICKPLLLQATCLLFFPLTFYIILFFIPAEGSTHFKIRLHGELSSMLRCHGESCSTHCALHRDARSPCWISESFTNFGEGWRTVHQKNTGHGDGWGTSQLPWSRISFWKMVKRKVAMRRYRWRIVILGLFERLNYTTLLELFTLLYSFH